MLFRPSFLAFTATVERLTAGRLYLWTFTFCDVVAPEEVRTRWNRLLTYLRRSLPSWCGVRVYELHPGRWGEFSHGLHIHVVTTRFQDIKVVLRQGKLAGFGRINVKRIPRARAGYVGKYLAKKRPAMLKGWRLWAAFGPTDRSKCRHWENCSMKSTLWRMGIASGRFRTLSFGEKAAIVSRWHWEWAAGVTLMQPWVHRSVPVGAFKPGRISGWKDDIWKPGRNLSRYGDSMPLEFSVPLEDRAAFEARRQARVAAQRARFFSSLPPDDADIQIADRKRAKRACKPRVCI